MIALDFSMVALDKVVTHHVGNKLRDENIRFSETPSIFTTETQEHLLTYFLSGFKPIDFCNFTHSVSLEMNEVYTIVGKIFRAEIDFTEASKQLATLVFEAANHPNIKAGEFNVVLFRDVVIDDEMVDVIGIFKSESDVPFLKMHAQSASYEIEHEFGFALKGIDKGCLIFNTNEAYGYSVLAIDNTNKNSETRYWVENFLQLKPADDSFNHTKEFMNFTKKFVTKELATQGEITKTDKIDLLNRTMDYFKTTETFDKQEFEELVLQDGDIIDSFRAYDDTARSENTAPRADSFEISSQAVKKQVRAFKSVLKLDKNFHVYIHGDKSLIERGVETDGRKFYKIYYEEER